MPGSGGYLLHQAGASLSWAAWSAEPSVVLGLVVLSGLYLSAVVRAGPAAFSWAGVQWPRLGLFFAGAVTLYVALGSPLDVGADRYLLTLHMVQHALLATVAPPLLLLGTPPEVLRRLVALPAARRLLALTVPGVAGAAFVVNMWGWHVPPLYEAALRELPLHITMHLSFIATGLLFWWPVLDPVPGRGRLSVAGKLVYLVATGFPMALLAALFLMMPTVIYPYYESAPRLWGVSPLTDQQVAGLAMGGLGELASVVAFSLLFLRYVHEGGD